MKRKLTPPLGAVRANCSRFRAACCPPNQLSEWEDVAALWRSAPLCADKPCSFCEHAMAPNNAWLLMCDTHPVSPGPR